ncbi:MAG: response regulator, partial [Candidatus Angelobacter sp.]
MLRMRGYEVHAVADLTEARFRLNEEKYHLVIVDVGHFAESGLEFCEEIKKQQPDLKVLMQAEDRVFPIANRCPDRVIPKQDGPHTFILEVERVLA